MGEIVYAVLFTSGVLFLVYGIKYLLKKYIRRTNQRTFIEAE